MKSIIEGIYNGTLPPFGESNTYVADEKTKKLIEMEHELMHKYPECKEAFEKYLENSTDLDDDLAYKQFLKGFKIGAKLMLEIIGSKD